VTDLRTVTISRGSGLSIFLQIKHQVIHDISKGELVSGQALPSIRQAAKQLGVTTATVRRAYAALEEEGFVVAIPGKGVIVSELGPIPTAETVRREESLLSLVKPSIVQALALGYRPIEVQQAVSHALADGNLPSTVLFVASEPLFVEHYAPFVAESVRDFPVNVVSMTVTELEAQRSALIPFPLCVVTLVRSFARTRDILRDTQLPVIALALDLAEETIAALVNVPRTARVVLIAEQMNLVGFLQTVNQYVAVQQPIVNVALEDASALSKLAGADCVIHSLRARQAIAHCLAPDREWIEIHHVPNPTSLHRLRQAVQARQSPAEVEEAAAMLAAVT
jgi:DNA-binding transcriptional regulator YhcF (GntR family)